MGCSLCSGSASAVRGCLSRVRKTSDTKAAGQKDGPDTDTFVCAVRRHWGWEADSCRRGWWKPWAGAVPGQLGLGCLPISVFSCLLELGGWARGAASPGQACS